MATAQDVAALREEIETLRAEREADRQVFERQRAVVPVATRVKDLSTANFIKVWKGDVGGPPVEEFLATLNDFAEAGTWSEEDKVRILKVKLEGTAKRFLNSRADLRSATFKGIGDALIERFKDRQPDQYHYSMFQSAVQGKGEDPRDFLDRLRALGDLTETKTDDPVKQEVIRSELQKRLLAIFTNGLLGVVGEQVRFRLPKTVDEALQIAITVYTEEKKKLNSQQEKRSVFTTSAVCYQCKKPGHIARNCRSGSNNDRAGPRFNVRPTEGRGYSGGPHVSSNGNRSDSYQSRVECFKCHKIGHIAKNCRVQGNVSGSTVNAQQSSQNNRNQNW